MPDTCPTDKDPRVVTVNCQRQTTKISARLQESAGRAAAPQRHRLPKLTVQLLVGPPNPWQSGHTGWDAVVDQAPRGVTLVIIHEMANLRRGDRLENHRLNLYRDVPLREGCDAGALPHWLAGAAVLCTAGMGAARRRGSPASA